MVNIGQKYFSRKSFKWSRRSWDNDFFSNENLKGAKPCNKGPDQETLKYVF